MYLLEAESDIDYMAHELRKMNTWGRVKFSVIMFIGVQYLDRLDQVTIVYITHELMPILI